MTNQYTPQTLTGYNASPPADDGSNTAANTVKWATHTDKIGDPLKNFAEAIDAAITSGFSTNMWNAINTQSTTYIVQLTDRGKLVVCSGTFTVTLPSAATVASGFAVGVKNGSTGVITVEGDGSETINDAASISLQKEDGVILVSDGTNWETTSRSLLAQITPGIAGEIITYDASDDLKTLAVGAAPGTDTATLFHSGQFLQTGGAGAEPSWQKPLISKRYVSAETAITADTVHTFAHGLGGVPTIVDVVLKCTDAGGDAGFVQDQEVSLNFGGNGVDRNVSVARDATNIKVTSSVGVELIDPSTFNVGGVTLTKWRLVVRAVL